MQTSHKMYKKSISHNRVEIAQDFTAIWKSLIRQKEQLKKSSWEEMLLFFSVLKREHVRLKRKKAGSYPKMQRAISSIIIYDGSHFFYSFKYKAGGGNAGNTTTRLPLPLFSRRKEN